MIDIDPNYDDPIVNEIHETRHKILARFNNDFAAYTEYLVAHPFPGVRYVKLPIRRLEPLEYDVSAPEPLMACEGE